MSRYAVILLAVAAMTAWPVASGSAEPATQPDTILPTAGLSSSGLGLGAYTYLSPQPRAQLQPPRQSCPVIIVQAPPQPQPVATPPPREQYVLPQTTLNYQPPAIAEYSRIQPIVPVPSTPYPYGYYGAAGPAVGPVGPSYPVTRPFYAPSPLPYGYVGVSPLFNQQTNVIVQP